MALKKCRASLGALFIVDTTEEATAIREASRLGIPTIGIVDTNADPSKVTYPIAANDDAIKTIALITGYIKEAMQAGQGARAKKVDTKPEDKKEEDK